MRTKTNFQRLFSIFLSAFFIISCTDDDTTVTEEDTSQAAELRLTAQADNIEDQSFSVVEYAYVETEEAGRQQMESFFPVCATITANPNGDGSGSVIVDFGAGCTLNNGALVAGMIVIQYDAAQSGTRSITYSYENFTYNGNEVSGGGSVLRQLVNDSGNPQSDLEGQIAIVFVGEEVTATHTVHRSREWIEGVGSGTWADNVFLVTGNWETSFSSGFNRSGVVNQTLRREATCPFFVSGTIDITRNNVEGVLDFGDGTCDNMATVTIGDNEFIIQL